MDQHPEMVKFLVEITNNQVEHILNYNDTIKYLDRDCDGDGNSMHEQFMKFRSKTAHQGPLTPKSNNYKGSRYNVLVEWEDGEVTFEPLDIIGTDDPILCAEYAERNGLLSTPGWKRFKRFINPDKSLERIVLMAKTNTLRPTLHMKHGHIVPRTHEDAMALDE
jgi:hypothetical protein